MAWHESIGCNTVNFALAFKLSLSDQTWGRGAGVVWNFGHCNFEFICYLVLEIWNFWGDSTVNEEISQNGSPKILLRLEM